VALGATVALIGLNAAWAANQASWKIDPGTATLCGAIIGLAIIGQQARRGFANLIKSQRNQSELDRDARLHQHAIEREREIEKRSNDRNVLLAAMWAETVTVWKQVADAEKNANVFALMHEGFHKTRMPSDGSKIIFASIKAPVFLANVSNLGLLGGSLAADVVAVLGRAEGQSRTVDIPAVLGHDHLSKLYQAHAEAMKLWRQDLYHVAIRIDAIANERPDPGGLKATEDERRKGS
jgi:hypothetical protein